jgi:hypothetical protein
LVAVTQPAAPHRPAPVIPAPILEETPSRSTAAELGSDDASNLVGPVDEAVQVPPVEELTESADTIRHCDANRPKLEPARDTLWKLETIRPFDDLETPAENEPVPVFPSATLEPGLVLNFDRPTGECATAPQLESPTFVPIAIGEPAAEIDRTLGRRRFRAHQSASLSLESEPADDLPVEQSGEEPAAASDPWAANVLAVCGGLLMLAGILYVTVDMIFWF